MPGRAIRNPFLRHMEEGGRHRIRCHYKCLTACKIDKAKYCIADALVKSYFGDVDDGLIFCGQNAYRVKRMTTVKELFHELVSELKAAEESVA